MNVDHLQLSSHQSLQQLVTKHPQTQHIKIIKPLAFEGVLNQSFNTMLKISLTVVIHWRGKKIVWIVVNSAINVIELFYNKNQADALVSILNEYEKITLRKKKDITTNTICVERCTDTLSGAIKKRDN